MYQTKRANKGLFGRREAATWISQRAPNSNTPVTPMSSQGDICRPTQFKAASGVFMTFTTR
jgi:hypothetical protein